MVNNNTVETKKDDNIWVCINGVWMTEEEARDYDFD